MYILRVPYVTIVSQFAGYKPDECVSFFRQKSSARLPSGEIKAVFPMTQTCGMYNVPRIARISQLPVKVLTSFSQDFPFSLLEASRVFCGR
jgi:hypothetical protein